MPSERKLLHNPELNWEKLACGMGVVTSRVETVEDFDRQFEAAMRESGPG